MHSLSFKQLAAIGLRNWSLTDCQFILGDKRKLNQAVAKYIIKKKFNHQ